MAERKGLRVHPIRGLFTIGTPAPERLALETHPGADIFSSYVPTAAAQRALALIHQSPGARSGKLFWVSGPASIGKTHLLNYLLALEQHASSTGAERGRSMTFAIEVTGSLGGGELESHLFAALADALSIHNRNQQMWRTMHGAPALNVALEQARRIGFSVVTGIIDFGLADSTAAAEYMTTLAQVAREFKQVKFTVIAASRWPTPAGAIALEVAPASADEVLTVAVRRARNLSESAMEIAAERYHGIDLGKLDPAAAFPFHPQALNVLHFLAYPPGTVAAIATLIRDALAASGRTDRLIYPADLAAAPAVMERAEARLGAGGRAALAIARRALAGLWGNERELAEQVVNTLALMRSSGSDQGVSTHELMALLPMLAAEPAGDLWPAGVVSQRLNQLATRSRGVIRYIAGAARFDPEAADAPEVASFNAALGLLRKFDPALSPAADKAEMETQLAHLAACTAEAIENADRAGRVLNKALTEAGAQLTDDSRRALDDYSTLAAGGARALIEIASDRERRERAVRTADQFDALARAAEMVPRIRTMREYLEATGLRLSYDDDPAKDPAIAALETESQLLAAELGPRILAANPRNLDALEARFQKFKWTYVQRYRIAHANWRVEMERTRAIADDLRQHLDALARLNAIAALGLPEGEELSAQAAAASRCVVVCGLQGQLAPDLSPRCPSCSYPLGAATPLRELSDLIERTGRALAAKLTALSHSAIARIISEHDREHRLAGFLKVIQAAQTEALVRVLDDRLARYLSQLLDENLGEAASQRRSPVAASPVVAPRRRRQSAR
jgi:hypothetical protein